MPKEEYIDNFVDASEKGQSATTAFAILQTIFNFLFSGLAS